MRIGAGMMDGMLKHCRFCCARVTLPEDDLCEVCRREIDPSTDKPWITMNCPKCGSLFIPTTAPDGDLCGICKRVLWAGIGDSADKAVEEAEEKARQMRLRYGRMGTGTGGMEMRG